MHKSLLHIQGELITPWTVVNKACHAVPVLHSPAWLLATFEKLQELQTYKAHRHTDIHELITVCMSSAHVYAHRGIKYHAIVQNEGIL